MNLLQKEDTLFILKDFSVDGGTQKQGLAIQKFNNWLWRQPPRTKLIVQGNHDLLMVDFPKSSSHYVSLAPQNFFLETSGLGTDTNTNTDTDTDGGGILLWSPWYATKLG